MRVTWGGDAGRSTRKGRILQFVTTSHDSAHAIVLEDFDARWGTNQRGRFVKVNIHELIPDPSNRN